MKLAMLIKPVAKPPSNPACGGITSTKVKSSVYILSMSLCHTRTNARRMPQLKRKRSALQSNTLRNNASLDERKRRKQFVTP